MRIGLKVDVDTLRGTREGVPALLRLFDEYAVKATFLFSLGPDHTGRALKRVFRPGFLSKVSRTSVTSHYGIKTLLYGTLLPGPNISKHAGDIMRAVRDAGHEVGIHCHDHIKWQDAVARKDAEWTRREFVKAVEAFKQVFGEAPRTHGAAGWQINPHVLTLEEEFGLDYASDGRGKTPFYPELQGVRVRVPQIPTTLPTLDELIGVDDISEDNVHEYVFVESQKPLPFHVYTLHAELEGMKLLPVMEKLLVMWKGSQRELGSVRDIYEQLPLEELAVHELGWGELPGRSGHLIMQGRPLARDSNAQEDQE